jgi:hypothetical protein
MTAALWLYAVGVVVGLWRTDARWPARVALALLWPVGPAAFLLTVSLLVAASLVAFPALGGLALLAAGLGWWLG